MDSMASPSQAPANPLLDAPKPWLVQLILTASLSDHAALLLCCKALRDLVRATVKPVQLSISPSQAGPWPQLLTACKPGAVLQLVVEGRQDTYSRQCTLNYAMFLEQMLQGERDMKCWDVNTQFLQLLCTKANTAAVPTCIGAPTLHHVTHLTLQGDVKGALLPTYVMLACPNLRYFTRPGSLKEVVEAPLATALATARCPHLHTLHLTDVDTEELSSLVVNAIRHQLQVQLSTLRTLRIDDLHNLNWSMGRRKGASSWLRLLDPLRQHVMSLHVAQLWVAAPDSELLSRALLWTAEPDRKQLFSTWQKVRHVHLSCSVYPHDVCCLLQAVPHLAQLNVKAFYEGDYSSCQGSWQQVQLSIRNPMTMEQLGCLPLSWVGSLRLSSLRVVATTQPKDVERARQNLAAHKDTLTISTLPASGRMLLQVGVTAPAALLPAVVSVLQLLQPVGMHVTVAADTLLPPAHACVVVPAVLQVGSSGMYVFRPAKVLLPKGYSLFRELPDMRVLELVSGGNDTIDSQQLMAVLESVCSEATGPAVLRLAVPAVLLQLGKGGPNLQAQLRAAMLAAGHQHVTLEQYVQQPKGDTSCCRDS